MTGLGFGEALGLVGAVHGLFLAAVLWTQSRGNRTANRLLALLLFLFSLHLLHIVLYWTRTLGSVVHFWGAVWLFPYLYGPILYLYVRASTAARFRLERRRLVHAGPLAAGVLVFAPFYLSDAAAKRGMLEASYGSTVSSPSPIVLAVWALQFVHFVLYLTASLRGASSAESAAEHRWLSRLLLAFTLSFVSWFAYGLAVGMGLAYSRAVDVAATTAMTLSIYGVGFTAIRDPEIFLGELRRRLRARYESSALDPSEVEELGRKLAALMRSKKPHLDAGLKLGDLAALLGVTPHELSRVVNQGFGQRFNDFVNRHRVEEAKRLLADPRRRDESLLSLAHEAGFNSKTSFNEAFKKHARTTPTRFRAEHGRPEL